MTTNIGWDDKYPSTCVPPYFKRYVVIRTDRYYPGLFEENVQDNERFSNLDEAKAQLEKPNEDEIHCDYEYIFDLVDWKRL